MTETAHSQLTSFYDTHPINEEEILAKVATSGASMDALTQSDLQDFDQDHYGGIGVVEALADAAGITEVHHVLDVCSGMGGPARWLAHRRGCKVTGLDVTESRVESARRLTHRVGLEHLVDFVHGDACAMPLRAGRYDVLIAQEAWLHIADKAALISECARVAKVGGTIAFTDVVALGDLEPETEARLATQIHAVNLASPERYAGLLERNGCTVVRQDDLSADWRRVLVERLDMYRSLRELTVERFGEARFAEYDDAYSFYVDCFMAGKLSGVRMVARKEPGA